MTREELPHLSDLEWDALGRMAMAIGRAGGCSHAAVAVARRAAC